MFVHPWPKLDHFTIYIKVGALLIITNVTFLLISEKSWRTRSEIKLLLDENFIFVVIQDEQFF
jgi:hypothetical protein